MIQLYAYSSNPLIPQTVWCRDHRGVVLTNHTVSQFLAERGKLSSETVYAMGSQDQTQLARELCAAYRRGYIGKLYLCGAQVVEDYYRIREATPQKFLLPLGELRSLPPALGGWRQVNQLDLDSYDYDIRVHPLYPFTQLFPSQLTDWEELLGLVLDPRNYTNPAESREHNTSWFESRLRVFRERVPVTAAARCWGYNLYREDYSEVPGFIRQCLSEAESFEDGVFKATKKFVRWLRHVWLSLIYPYADMECLIEPLMGKDYELYLANRNLIIPRYHLSSKLDRGSVGS